jgi:hypothetical protein
MNCIRVNTYRSVTTEEIFVHDMVLYFNPPNPEERLVYGSNSVALKKDGSFGPISINIRGHFSRTLPASEKKLEMQDKIPKMDKLIKIAVEIAESTPYHRRLGMDMTIDESEHPYLIEINNGPLGTAQMLNGALFKSYTDEVIEYCIRNKSKANFNFTW